MSRTSDLSLHCLLPSNRSLLSSSFSSTYFALLDLSILDEESESLAVTMLNCPGNDDLQKGPTRWNDVESDRLDGIVFSSGCED